MPRNARVDRPAFLLLMLLALASGPAGAEKLSLERLFAGPDLSGPSLRGAQISPDGRLVTYLKAGPGSPGRLDLWAYDIRAGAHRQLVDASSLVASEGPLSAEEAGRRERSRSAAFSGIVSYEFSPDSTRLLVPLGGDLYLYDLTAPPGRAVRRLTRTPAYETDARFSPAGHYVSYVRDQDLYVYDLATDREQAVTRGGGGPVSNATAEFVAQEEMGRSTGYWWSPDERRIAYVRLDESPVAELERFEITADGARVVRQRYPVAGAANARVDLHVVGSDGSNDRPMDLGPDPDFYLARVDWFPDSGTVAVQRQSRDQRRLVLLAVDPATGRGREILKEQSDAWVDLHDELTFLKRSPRFIWASSRSGYRHLYLYRSDGTLEGALTAGEFSVVGDGFRRAIAGVDEAAGRVYFMATADSPLERQLYAVPLKPVPGPAPARPSRLTRGAGWHSVTMAKDTRVYLDSFSTPEQPPSVTLHSIAGATLATLVANELTPDHPYAPYLSEHVASEFGTLRAADGQILHYQLLKPRDLPPGRRVPVIVDVYGGPGGQKVRRAWGSSSRGNEGFFRQYLAQHGYGVFSLDNRGTAARGVVFETALRGRLGRVEVEDQVRGAEYLRTLPWVDPDHIGIFGWSYGGYMALMCSLEAPGTFAAAAAGAPVTDWRLYDTHYAEQFLGLPADNPAGYEGSSVLAHADALRTPLLLVHGMADDNVFFANTTALVQRLQALGKPFDLMVYPGGKHGLLRRPDMGLHAYRTIVDFFDRNLRGGADQAASGSAAVAGAPGVAPMPAK